MVRDEELNAALSEDAEGPENSIYGDLHRIAVHLFRDEAVGHTLQPTAIVHEAYLRLAQSDLDDTIDRSRLCRLAAGAMRRVLIDHARSRCAIKRGSGRRPLELDPGRDAATEPDAYVLALDEALRRLADDDPRAASIVELRFFGGLGVDEIAATTGLSTATVKREWAFARTWLHREIERGVES